MSSWLADITLYWVANLALVLGLCACCIACVYFSSDLAAGPEPVGVGYFQGTGE